MNQRLPVLDDNAVLELTKNGKKELHEPGTVLASAQLEALVLIDGLSNVAQVLKRAGNLAPGVLRESLNELIKKGFVSVVTASDTFDTGDFFTIEPAHTAIAEAGEQTQADADAELLRRNGYCVNMARSPTIKQVRPAGHKLEVLIIDDDPDICNLLQMYLKLEGFETRTAGNRDEIVAALRRTPLPDMVLLDVWMPDANGFDVLAKMRQHPALKGLPVIMLTAEATRAAVLKGILGGADGYITKPFQIHPLVKAIKTVLGLKFDPKDQDWDFSL
ncbi:MAG: response regulator [Sideroxyarcus sp.]|nr:response regulator [Sideroxyarcus sp.]